MRERPAHLGRGDVECTRGAVVCQAHADVDAYAETDARDREPELPRMAQIEAQRRSPQQAGHDRKSSMRPARIVSTRLACAASSALWLATINVALRSLHVRRSR